MLSTTRYSKCATDIFLFKEIMLSMEICQKKSFRGLDACAGGNAFDS